MSKPRFFADHDFNEHIVRGVRRREPLVDCQLCRELGLAMNADEDILQYAAENQLIILSHDVNTMSAAAKDRIELGKPMNGLLLVHQKSAIGQIIDDLIVMGHK